ncbi:uroporphyrinogen-III C-methyltransferase [Collimonas sp.]|jgi:uroporphyrin-III C-methyltransferase|uniref:uroporphyrinogen-III C-methyltransferase n=1 Tax=Collimonas sp. TaxID=1963772 RepID=UPI002C5501A6|nr:uroporphyrinogen-III C-methyltransferase [Collimonas sp.]HWW99188.1 uroporphyrinogen-III C-methyltransferase [Collimonas sp.]
MCAGKVILVGAGPGDPELLTLKAVKAIAEADVLLVDDLVNSAILQHAREAARIIHVGKRGGCRSTSQEFIQRLMVLEAHGGHCVVRLKGGDPYLFGRGGEERAYLRQAGVAVEVVPGITSGMAAAASIGVAPTHRDYSQGVIFVTGHGKSDAAQPNWPALAASGLTLVIYMGVARCRELQQLLLDAGMAESMPVAVVQSATLPAQAQLLTCLGRLSQDLSASALGSPSIIVIGEAVRCADAFVDIWPQQMQHALS